MHDIKHRVEEALDAIRPYLAEDGGDVEFVAFEEKSGTLEVRLLGACADCPMASMTLRAGVERYLKKKLPEIVRVEQVK